MVMTLRHTSTSDHGPGRRGYHPGADSQFAIPLYWSLTSVSTRPRPQYAAGAGHRLAGSPALSAPQCWSLFANESVSVADHRVQHHVKRLPAAAGDDTDVGRHRDKSQHISFGARVVNYKQPVVWSPVIAPIIVLADIHIPQTISMSLGLL